MGASTSKQEVSANSTDDKTSMNMELVLDQGVKKQIDKLSEYVSMFNSNDVKPLLQVIDDYKMNLETSTGNSYNLNNVKTFVGKFHQELLDKITSDFPTLSDQEKQTKLSERLKDRALPDYLNNIYDNKLKDLKTEVMKSPIVQNDSKMTQNIGRIFTDITNLKAKYKYFEYRYIQLNLFLIVFIQHTYSTMDKFINSVLAYTVVRDSSRSDALKQLINLLLDIMRQAELSIDQKDFEAIDGLMSVVEGSIKDKQVVLTEAIEKARVDAIDEMLKVVMANHDVFADKTVSEFANPNSSTGFVKEFGTQGNATPKSQSARMPQMPIGNSQMKTTPTNMFGGFVRDHSRFPQAFYDLGNK